MRVAILSPNDILYQLILPQFGYDTLPEVQPATVDLGFCIFLTVPPIIGFLLAILSLYHIRSTVNGWKR
jgi:hypothetical protein